MRCGDEASNGLGGGWVRCSCARVERTTASGWALEMDPGARPWWCRGLKESSSMAGQLMRRFRSVERARAEIVAGLIGDAVASRQR